MARSSHRAEGQSGNAVFDLASRSMGAGALRTSGNHYIEMHRTERDRRPPSRVVTGQILGDPAPGRSAQDRYEAALRLT